MLFNSLTFICFILLVHLIYSLPLSWEKRKTHLWLSSYVFYAAWNPPFVLLLWLSTCVDWFAGKRIGRAKNSREKKLFLTLSLLTNLGLLGYFKYGDFLLDNFVLLLQWFGVHYQAPQSNIILPVGISFYTFQSLSYSLDIYRGKMKPWTRFSDFALFVTFFPQLVAGPIVRAVDFLPQCKKPRRASISQFGWGMSLFLLGLFEKVILADRLTAPISDKVFANSAAAGTMDVLIGVLAFSAQVFFDFSGYSLCAIGIAMTLGFVLPDNFRFPYAAVGFSDFWTRWHISLSSWLRDYLYIPLGGNRGGQLRTLSNLTVTMLLGGLWHGASWTYVAWGGLHGIYLIIERVLVKTFGNVKLFVTKPARFFLGISTFLLVSFTYLFFRSPSFTDAFQMLNSLVSYQPQQVLENSQNILILTIIALLLTAQACLRNSSLEALAARLPRVSKILILTVILLSLTLQSGGTGAFIYFQF